MKKPTPEQLAELKRLIDLHEKAELESDIAFDEWEESRSMASMLVEERMLHTSEKAYDTSMAMWAYAESIDGPSFAQVYIDQAKTKE